ncbi:MAG: homocysteine S-methyltransferase family protein [Ignavibacteria bacterium]|nr:homocysteine S-methyltransferase family protein [Ignavibacteria bacterium]
MTSRFNHELENRILVFDGATGTTLQTQNLTADDFGGPEYEGCNEYLVVTNPRAVEAVHRGFLEAGADIIETNTFGSTGIVLAEYHLAHMARELNVRAARIARRLADEFSTPEKPRFVAGSIGPTTKLPSLGHIAFDDMRDSYREQIEGLVEGGADLLCIETCQDPLQIKAALAAARMFFDARGERLPVIVSVTIEAMGTMLMGTDIGAAIATVEPYDIVTVFGMNCATGPKEMEDNLRTICATWEKPVFVMPNAGIPENVGGTSCYHLTPDELEHWMTPFVEELGVGIIGGCCGTTPEHIARLAALAAGRSPKVRAVRALPSVASMYAATPMKVDIPPVLIGERCNANGSKLPRPAARGGLGRHRRHGQGAGSRRSACARCLRRLRRQRRSARHDGSHPPIQHADNDPVDDRFHRTGGDRDGPQTLRGPRHRQFDQPRRRRGAAEPRAGTVHHLRRRRGGADHRRGRHGENRAAQARDRHPHPEPRRRRTRHARAGPHL